MAVRAVRVERASSRQLELLGESPAAPTSAPDTAVVAQDGRSVGERAARSGRERAPSRDRKLPRLAVSPGEAAEMLGVSRDYFDEHVIGDLRVVRRGRRILVPVAELERWLARNAARAAALSGV